MILGMIYRLVKIFGRGPSGRDFFASSHFWPGTQWVKGSCGLFNAMKKVTFGVKLHEGFGVFRFVPPADSPGHFLSLNFRRLLKTFSYLRKFKMKNGPGESAGGTNRKTPKPLC